MKQSATKDLCSKLVNRRSAISFSICLKIHCNSGAGGRSVRQGIDRLHRQSYLMICRLFTLTVNLLLTLVLWSE